MAAYDQHGFDVNQDLPGNMLWEELYEASPKGTKVILTIRESDEKWWKSWCGFMLQERPFQSYMIQVILQKNLYLL